MTCVAVTGAGGFIGSHLCEELVRRGARVRALLHYASRRHDWLRESPVADEIETVFGDVTEGDWLRGALKGCETVYHLAAEISVAKSFELPRLFDRVNTCGTLRVLETAPSSARVLVMSSSEVLGTAKRGRIQLETDRLRPQSPYAVSKARVERYARSAGALIARPFNVFGPRQSCRAVIPRMIAQMLLNGSFRLQRWGVARDWTYVADTVTGLIQVAGRGRPGRVYQLASGEAWTLGRVADLLDPAGRCLRETTGMARPEGAEVWRLRGSAERARRECGWRPGVSFPRGLQRTVEWWRARVAHDPAGVRAELELDA